MRCKWGWWSGGREGRTAPTPALTSATCQQSLAGLGLWIRHCAACPDTAQPSRLRVSVFGAALLPPTRTPVTRFRAHSKSKMTVSPQPRWIWKPFFQIRSHPEVPGEHGFWGTLSNLLHQTKTTEQSSYKPELAREGTGFLNSLTPKACWFRTLTDTRCGCEFQAGPLHYVLSLLLRQV